MLKCNECGNDNYFKRPVIGYEEYTNDQGFIGEVLDVDGWYNCGDCGSENVAGKLDGE